MADEKPHFTAEIHIEAEPDAVWDVLMDYEALSEWSNAFRGTDKPMKEGEVSTAYFFNPATHQTIEFTHPVHVYEPKRRFGWSGKLGGGHHDRHIYEMLPHPEGGTIFRQSDGLYGKPSSIMTRMMEHTIDHTYKSFNKRLKARVESLYPKARKGE